MKNIINTLIIPVVEGKFTIPKVFTTHSSLPASKIDYPWGILTRKEFTNEFELGKAENPKNEKVAWEKFAEICRIQFKSGEWLSEEMSIKIKEREAWRLQEMKTAKATGEKRVYTPKDTWNLNFGKVTGGEE